MSDSHRDFDFTRLSVAERILLLQNIWDSLPAEPAGISPEELKELDRRWNEYQAGTMSAAPWAEVKSRLARE
ncbi:MAG TPA: addiction module protein [Urbifossiella sp.]|nr:addiction module protein [Urbifossiella sp.]